MQIFEILLYISVILMLVAIVCLNLSVFNYWFLILQQNRYLNLKSLKFFYLENKLQLKLTIVTLCLFALNVLFVLFLFNYVKLLVLLNLLIIFSVQLYLKHSFSKIKTKLSLIVTKRVVRLYVTYIILNLLLLLFVLNLLKFSVLYLILFGLFYAFQGVIIVASNIINLPVEFIIKYYYIKKAKQKLKKYPNLQVVAITGSYGKTSTKNYLYQLLKHKFNVLITPNSFNTPMGITKTILQNLNAGYDIFIVEMGADHKNDIKKLCNIIKPNISVITAVGTQHLKTFKTLKNIIETKYQIVKYAKQNVVFFTNSFNKVCKNYFDISKCEKYCVGNTTDNDVILKDFKFENITRFTLNINNVDYCFKTRLLGEYNVQNLALCIMIATKLGVSLNVIKSAVKNIYPVPHRLSLMCLANGAKLIDDSFNSNEYGAMQALNVLQSFNKIKVVITCGMIELGGEQYEKNYNFGKQIANVADYVCVVNKTNRDAIINGLLSQNYNMERVFEFDDFKSVFDQVLKLANKNCVVLIENDLPDSYK